MSDSNPNNPTSGAPAESKGSCCDLQSQIQTLRICVLVLGTFLAAFFYREAKLSALLAESTAQQAAQVAEFKAQLAKQGTSIEKQEQNLRNIVGRLIEYARTHPDFVPVLTKHGVPVQAAGATNTGAAAPKKP